MTTLSPASPLPVFADPLLLRAWETEVWLARVRLANVPLCLLVIPLVPDASRPLTIALAFVLALSDAADLILLRFAPRPSRLRAVRMLATAIEWKGGLGVIALCAPFPAIPAPALLLVLLALTAGRYGERGLLGATTAAWLTLLTLVGAQAQLLGVRDAVAAWRAGLGWGLFVGLMALGLAVALGLAARRQHPDAAPRGAVAPATPQVPLPASQLSAREAEVLALLLETEGARRVPRKEMARRLTITEDTVKTHMRHLAIKLGAEDASREAILRAAHGRGLPSRLPRLGDDE